MLKPTLASTYALQAVIYLAAVQKEKGNIPLASHKIAREWNIPERFLLKVLKPLVSAGILESLKGPSGGYRLARSPKDITLRDIVEAVDGPFQSSLPPAVEINPQLREWLGQIWARLVEHIRESLSQFSIEDYLSLYNVQLVLTARSPSPERAPSEAVPSTFAEEASVPAPATAASAGAPSPVAPSTPPPLSEPVAPSPPLEERVMSSTEPAPAPQTVDFSSESSTSPTETGVPSPEAAPAPPIAEKSTSPTEKHPEL